MKRLISWIKDWWFWQEHYTKCHFCWNRADERILGINACPDHYMDAEACVGEEETIAESQATPAVKEGKE